MEDQKRAALASEINSDNQDCEVNFTPPALLIPHAECLEKKTEMEIRLEEEFNIVKDIMRGHAANFEVPGSSYCMMTGVADIIKQTEECIDLTKSLSLIRKRQRKPVVTYVSVVIFPAASFSANKALGLLPAKYLTSYAANNAAITFYIPHTQRIDIRIGVRLERLYEIVGQSMKLKPHHFLLWRLAPTKSRRDVLLPTPLTDEFLASKEFGGDIKRDHFIFVQDCLPKITSSYSFDKHVLLIFKCMIENYFIYCDHMIASWDMTVKEALKKCFSSKKDIGKKCKDKVNVFHEIGGDEMKGELVRQINLNVTLRDALKLDDSGCEILIIDNFKNICESKELWLRVHEFIVTCPDNLCIYPPINSVEDLACFHKYCRTVKVIGFDGVETKLQDFETSLKIPCKYVEDYITDLAFTSPRLDATAGIDVRLFGCSKFGFEPFYVIPKDSNDPLERYLADSDDIKKGDFYKLFFAKVKGFGLCPLEEDSLDDTQSCKSSDFGDSDLEARTQLRQEKIMETMFSVESYPAKAINLRKAVEVIGVEFERRKMELLNKS